MKQISHNDFLATPTPFNNLLWYIIISTSEKYYVGYYSLLDRDLTISFQPVRKNDSLLTEMCESEELDNFIRFTQGYYCISSQNDSLIISDMRMGQNGGWYKYNAPFIFSFYAQGEKGSCKNLQQSRFESLDAQSLSMLITRIKGK